VDRNTVNRLRASNRIGGEKRKSKEKIKDHRKIEAERGGAKKFQGFPKDGHQMTT
jgi:hypothetical protein